MKIAKNLTIDTLEFASQGNAILGIRDSGKTYTATYLAEQLMDEGIPFISFDPIGIWRYLREGKNGKGYPVVVAGDNGDLPLTPQNAANIVRAAMQENVSLVIDLYSMHLSKSDWKKIVETSIRLLLYENKNCGLRHVFIEEAAEFVPQLVRPDDGRVYAEIEKLARMGGNASLGYTLINQRAEQVNKSVLELCDCLFLHRQKGRHSITALNKWLDAADVSTAKEISNSLPSLQQGECWVWMQGSYEPKRITIPEKKTVHPDRKNPRNNSHGIMADVSSFVARMERALKKSDKPDLRALQHGPTYMKDPAPSKLQTTIDELKEQLSGKDKEISGLKKDRSDLQKKLDTVKKMLAPQYDQMKKIFSEAGAEESHEMNNGVYEMWLDKFSGKQRTMLELMIQHKRLDRRRWTTLAGIIYTSSYFDKAATRMRQLKLIGKEGNEFVLLEI